MSDRSAENAVARGELACIDGRQTLLADATISVTDEGLLRGDGVFELLRVYGGGAFALEEHLDRLEHSAAGIRLPEIDRAALTAEIGELLRRRGDGDYALRLVITRGGRRIAMTEPLRRYPPTARLALVEYQPTLVLNGLKTLSYGANMQCTRLAQERGFDEALLVTPAGEVLEAPTAAIFWTAGDGVLCTPPIGEGILASITRAAVIETTGARERVTTRADLLGAAEAFLASTVREVQAVAAVERHKMTAPGPRTAEAAERFQAYLAERPAAMRS